MKTVYLFLLVFFALTMTCHAQTRVPPRPSTQHVFPKIGVSYYVTFPAGANVTGKPNEDRIKIIAAGNNYGWFFVEDYTFDAHLEQKWINFAFVLSAREVPAGE